MDSELRYVELKGTGYTLRTYDTYHVDRSGKTIIGYEFRDPTGRILFEGEDFACSPNVAIDSDKALRALLTFLTLKPGDTDREYFDSYTLEQMDFAQSDAEYLSMWSMEEERMPFVDLDDRGKPRARSRRKR